LNYIRVINVGQASKCPVRDYSSARSCVQNYGLAGRGSVNWTQTGKLNRRERG
jgi:hypothetical protein